MNPPNEFEHAAERFADQAGRGSVIRAVNFHNTPRRQAGRIEAQLERYARDFTSVNESDLHRTGSMNSRRRTTST